MNWIFYHDKRNLDLTFVFFSNFYVNSHLKLKVGKCLFCLVNYVKKFISHAHYVLYFVQFCSIKFITNA